MNLKRRIDKLARLYPPDPNCPACGYPASARLRVIVTPNADPLPTCGNCGARLDEDGVPLPRIYKRIILPPEPGCQSPFP